MFIIIGVKLRLAFNLFHFYMIIQYFNILSLLFYLFFYVTPNSQHIICLFLGISRMNRFYSFIKCYSKIIATWHRKLIHVRVLKRIIAYLQFVYLMYTKLLSCHSFLVYYFISWFMWLY